MNLLISGHHIDLTPALRDYVENKLERIIRHFDQIVDVAVILGLEKPSDKDRRQRAEANLRIKGAVLHVEHFAQDLYAAIDGLADKLDRQVLKHKERIRDHQHEGVKHITAEGLQSGL